MLKDEVVSIYLTKLDTAVIINRNRTICYQWLDWVTS